MPAHVREFRPSDAAAAALLIPQLTPNIVRPESLQERLAQLVYFPTCKYFVVECDHVVVGFGGICWYPIPSKGMMGWIEEFVVNQNHRGLGFGRMLMASLLAKANNMQLEQIKLTTANPVAQDLYESFGFIEKQEKLFVRKRSA